MALEAVCVGAARNRIEVMSHERNDQLILKKLISELRDMRSKPSHSFCV
jgi:hypothetical protein